MPSLLRHLLLVSTACGSLGLLAPPARAQKPAPPEAPLEVRTFLLSTLSSSDAARMVAPYVQSPMGGVFDVPGARAITVRETRALMATIDSVLRIFDRQHSVRLHFQLVETSDATLRDPAIASVETVLRELFKFPGYRLAGQTTSMVGSGESFSTALSVGPRRFRISGSVSRVTPGTAGSLRLSVELAEADSVPVVSGAEVARSMLGEGRVLSTGLTVPLDQTIVLGSGTPVSNGRVLILVVRAESEPPRR